MERKLSTVIGTGLAIAAGVGLVGEVSPARANTKQGYPDGTPVEVVTKDGYDVFCTTGQAEGLQWPLAMNSPYPSNHASCDVQYPISQLVGVKVNGQPVYCTGEAVIPMKPDNCALVNGSASQKWFKAESPWAMQVKRAQMRARINK